MKKRKLRKTSCISCRAEIANRYFASHKCKKTEDIDIPKDLKCPFCGSQSHNSGLYVIHVKHCKLNPDAKQKSEKWHQAMHNRKGKGTNHYTKAKETGIPYIISDETRQKLSAAHKRRFKDGVPEETKRKISESMKIAHSEGRAYNIGMCRWNNEMSYPETFFSKVIENEFVDKNYTNEYPVSKYSIDFAWVEKKLAIEIDGCQHEKPDYKARDIRKDKCLAENGWKVLRIKWKDLFHDTKHWISVAKEFIHSDI